MSPSHPPDEPILNSDATRPMSIDLSLELERQLEAESVPNSPNPPRPQSLDATILATIVTHLRQSLTETTKERDTLAEKVAEAQTRQEGMRDALEHVTDKCIRMENELEVASSKQQENEETIAMLRSKLEESRRALMRLQTERRMSVASNLSLDLSRPPPVLPSLSGPPSSKRASFAPLTGSPAGRASLNHRRISSISDSGFLLTSSSTGEPPTWPPMSPISQHMPQDNESTPTDRYASPAKNRRISLLFGRGATAQESPSDIELELLRKQLRTAQQQLDDTKHELIEAQEAREASELCVRALRTFISENNVGVPLTMQTHGSPVTPTHPSHSKQGSTASRWGFRLWAASDADAAKSTPLAPTPVSSYPSEPSSTVSTHGQSIHRTFGGFFGTKINTTSNTPPSHLPYDPMHQDAMYNSSDTSSLADSTGPISPASEAPRPSAGFAENTIASEGAKLEMASYDHTRDLAVASLA